MTDMKIALAKLHAREYSRKFRTKKRLAAQKKLAILLVSVLIVFIFFI
jgi:hypothetical protein